MALIERHIAEFEPRAGGQALAVGYTAPDARAALVVASNALAQVVPVLVALAGQGATNDTNPTPRRMLRLVA